MAKNKLAKDLSGMTFGDWTVEKMAENHKKGHRYYLCHCICGKTKILRGSMLSNGNSRSCGCTTRTPLLGNHKQSKSYTYSTWLSMRYRCSKKDYAGYERYGKKGITVCPEWDKSFSSFIKDMGERPKGMTIDRIDNSLGYFKENCRWASKKEQTLNRGVTKWLTYDGETLCLTDMAKKYKMNSTMLLSRLNKGMSIIEAIETKNQRKMYFFVVDGVKYNYSDFCKKYGLSRSTVDNNRIKFGSFSLAVGNQLQKKGISINFSIIETDYKFKM